MAGCVMIPDTAPYPESPDTGVETGIDPVPIEPAPASGAPPASAPVASPVAPVERPPGRALVLVADSVDAFPLTGVVAALEARALEVEVGAVSLAGEIRRPSQAPQPSSLPPGVVIAVGSAAARAALDVYDAPTLFCQVADVGFAPADQAYGIATVPPPALQLKAWKAVSPQLKHIALVLGTSSEPLAAEAAAAAEGLGLVLHIRHASSDREAVYLFRRLAPDVDGLWLLPDNSVLSPRSIREMLDYADAHELQTLAFTPTLFEWGALLSATGTDSELVSVLSELAARLVNGAGTLAPITPLSELELRINADVAPRFGLSPQPARWVFGRDDS